MSRPSRHPPADPRAREKAADLARTAGRMGAMRVPDEALVILGPEASDTAVFAVLSALDAGQLERRAARQSDPGYQAAVVEELLQTPEAV